MLRRVTHTLGPSLPSAGSPWALGILGPETQAHNWEAATRWRPRPSFVHLSLSLVRSPDVGKAPGWTFTTRWVKLKFSQRVSNDTLVPRVRVSLSGEAEHATRTERRMLSDTEDQIKIGLRLTREGRRGG